MYEVTSDRHCLSDDRVVPMSEPSDAISDVAEARSLANDWNFLVVRGGFVGERAGVVEEGFVIEGPSLESACKAFPNATTVVWKLGPFLANRLRHVVHELAERAALVGAHRPERLDQLVEQRDRLIDRLRQRRVVHRDHPVVPHDSPWR